ncbi:hypothetical protein Maes01_01442 [Microbulbifer aestuariivivens]|uniref:Tetratricopeptide repeat protein n=1 Tax=Microbulbifer aestuariivivens TaxID=1908308 RepID=A0ABP9WNV5_9GAMM
MTIKKIKTTKWLKKPHALMPHALMPHALMVLLVLFCVACSTHGPSDSAVGYPFGVPVDSHRLLAESPLMADFDVAESLVAGPGGVIPQQQIMALTPEIRAFLAGLAGASAEEKWSVLVGMFRNGMFSVDYDTLTTLPAAETFARREGNCLSVTILLAAMARELGLKGTFNEVDVPNTRTEEGGVLINLRHINLVLELSTGPQVIDFGVVDFEIAFNRRALSDQQALAQYFSNVGAERLLAGDYRAAFLNMREALRLSPGNSDFWVNLGVLYEKQRLPEYAEQAFIQALQLDPLSLVAARNLERLLAEQGRESVAAGLTDQVVRLRSHNPVFAYFAARSAYQEDRFGEARKLLESAIRRDNADHRLHFLLGKVAFVQGDFPLSKKHLRHAFALVDDPQIKRDYERQLFDLRK